MDEQQEIKEAFSAVFGKHSGGGEGKEVGKFGKNTYLTFKDDPVQTVMFQLPVISGYVHWVEKKPYICTKYQGGCGFCDDGLKAKKTFKCNVITTEKGKAVMKVYSFGPMVGNQLDILNSVVDLTSTPLEITKEGTGLQTTYTVKPIVNLNLDAQAKIIAEAKGTLPSIALSLGLDQATTFDPKDFAGEAFT